ncbi:MAG: tetratricopeptide repeat protein [Cyanobacteria bacterium HKST-UBA02]|nr:tetratricopeptide repeat protein [Cyanobacteria bacterium HKST-UBA02]
MPQKFVESKRFVSVAALTALSVSLLWGASPAALASSAPVPGGSAAQPNSVQPTSETSAPGVVGTENTAPANSEKPKEEGLSASPSALVLPPGIKQSTPAKAPPVASGSSQAPAPAPAVTPAPAITPVSPSSESTAANSAPNSEPEISPGGPRALDPAYAIVAPPVTPGAEAPADAAAAAPVPIPTMSPQEKAATLKTWEQIQKHGAEAFRVCEYGKAERLLKDAVALERKLDDPDIRFAASPGDLGRLLTVRGRFKEAEPYLEEEVYLKEVALGTGSGDLIQPMGDLITFYLKHGSKSKANPMTERVIDYVQGKFREQASMPQGKIKLTKGMPLKAWAGSAAPVMRDPLLEWAITCDALGDLHRYAQNYELADRLYKVALDVKGTILGKKHLSLANSYDNLGVLCLDKGEQNDAESYFKDALSITERILEPGDPQIFNRMDKLARCLIKGGKYSEAEAIYIKARDTWGGGSSKSVYAQRAHFALGCLYSDRKQYSAAANELHRALRLAEEINGSYSIQLVPYLRKYAYVLYYLGRRGEQEQLKARAHNIAPVM